MVNTKVESCSLSCENTGQFWYELLGLSPVKWNNLVIEQVVAYSPCQQGYLVFDNEYYYSKLLFTMNNENSIYLLFIIMDTFTSLAHFILEKLV